MWSMSAPYHVTPFSVMISKIISDNDPALHTNYADIFLAPYYKNEKYLVHFKSIGALLDVARDIKRLTFSAERYCLLDNDEMLMQVMLSSLDEIMFVIKLDTFEVTRYD